MNIGTIPIINDITFSGLTQIDINFFVKFHVDIYNISKRLVFNV
jgi:hypothetical protein